VPPLFAAPPMPELQMPVETSLTFIAFVNAWRRAGRTRARPPSRGTLQMTAPAIGAQWRECPPATPRGRFTGWSARPEFDGGTPLTPARCRVWASGHRYGERIMATSGRLNHRDGLKSENHGTSSRRSYPGYPCSHTTATVRVGTLTDK